jgi:hypothetical protein
MNVPQIVDAVRSARANLSPRVMVVLHTGRTLDVSGLTPEGVLNMLRVWGVPYAEIAHFSWTLPKPKSSSRMKDGSQCLD